MKRYYARSVSLGLGGPFCVSGGPFAHEQVMGWHITDEDGFTVAVSCDAEFVKRALGLTDGPIPRDTADCWKIGRDYVRAVPIDQAVRLMESYPEGWAPQNPYYVKNHVNAPGTVRSWFRKMRAADFEHHIMAVLTSTFYVGREAPWSLLDTQQVVDRETAATYPPPFEPMPFVGRLPQLYGRLTFSREEIERAAAPKRLKLGDVIIHVDRDIPPGLIICNHATRRAILVAVEQLGTDCRSVPLSPHYFAGDGWSNRG